MELWHIKPDTIYVFIQTECLIGNVNRRKLLYWFCQRFLVYQMRFIQVYRYLQRSAYI